MHTFAHMSAIIIAIDGYSSCGKSTLAKALATRLHYGYVDSGAMYRAVTLYFLEQKIDFTKNKLVMDALRHIQIHFELNGITKRNETWLNGRMVEDLIRSKSVSDYVSPVAALPAVRHQMVALQRLAGIQRSIVMDGRDIGTHVFPDAELKIFMTADPEVRALRRYRELLAKGESWTMEAVRENLRERDRIDSTRSENPLRQAPDALVLDNSHVSEAEQLEIAYQWAQNAINSKTAKD
jgi:cytidylate kinase